VLHAGTLDGTDDPDASDTALNGASLGQVLFGTPDELATPFDVYESELEGTNASIQLQATNSISSIDTFDVTIQTGNSLTMQTRNNTGDETGTSLTPGIHLTDVSFQTGGTGTITIATGTDGAGGGGTGASAGIEVANLTTAGGAVTVGTEDGGITVGDVTTQGSAAAVDGVAGGAIRVQAGDADQSGDSDVITGLLNASGGNGGTGKGGNGGVVTVQSNGAVQDIAGTTTDPTLGGGSITVAGIIDTSGGDTSGGTGATGGNGGAVQLGGARQVGLVSLGATSGPITVTGSIDTSGGNGPTGGNGGSIAIETRDSNGGAASAHITTADLVTRGGDGTAGAGGNGGLVSVNTRQSIAITGATNEADNQDPAGGGSIAIASIDTSGGNGADGRGGSGSRVTVTTQSGEVRIGPSVPTAATVIDTTGGAGHTAAGAGVGGRGGVVDVRAGTAEDDTSDLQLFGNIDAREGTSDDPDTLATDGGNVTLVAGGDIEHGGQAGPHIRTGGSVSFSADGNIGASSPIRVEGHEVEGRATNQLNVSAGGTARVDATNVGFLFLNATATTAVADIRITQEGDDGGNVIDMAGSGGQMVVNRVDTRDNQVDAEVVFSNPDDDAPDGTLVLATGTSPTSGIHAGGTLRVTSDGDLVIGTTDGTVIHSVERDPGAAAGDPLSASFVLLAADADADGSGAMRDAAGANTTGRIDMLGDADEAGELNLYAGEGVGTPGDSITISGGGNVSALNAAKIEDPDNEGQFIPDPDADTGVFIRNEVDGDLAIVTSSQFPGVFAGAVVDAGSGDIEITNEVGDLTVQSATVRAKSQDADDGPGGDITLAVEGSGDRIVLDTTAPIVSGGVQTYQGDVALARPTLMTADDGIAIEGGLDASDGDVASTVSLTATLGDEVTDVTSFSVQDGVGATQAFQEFAIRTPDGGDVALDAPIVRTTGSQLYGADLALTQPTAFTAGSRIVFDKDGDQGVTAPAGGFSLDAGGTPLAIPAEATIAKADGSLTLSSSGGPVTIGDGDKLSVAGSLALSGTTVRFTDLSALDVSVTSPDTQIFARGPGAVTTPGDATVADGGTDIVANTVTFSAEPTVIGAGPAPRIATQSGTAVNPGSRVLRLPVAIREEDIANGSRVFDLAIPEIDPGHETPDARGRPGRAAVRAAVSQDEAGPGRPCRARRSWRSSACAPLGEELAPSGCAETAPPAYGSALDTERAVEVARAYRELLGDSAHARAGRESLANAATNAKAELGAGGEPGRTRLPHGGRARPGPDRAARARRALSGRAGDVLTAVAAAIGAPKLDARGSARRSTRARWACRSDGYGDPRSRHRDGPQPATIAARTPCVKEPPDPVLRPVARGGSRSPCSCSAPRPRARSATSRSIA
jgi:hypothetical protein